VSEWHVPKGRRLCRTCETEFQPDDPLWSMLMLRESQIERDDYCPACEKEADRSDALCVWKTTAPNLAKPKKRMRLNTEAGGELLKRLVEEADPQHRALCYVLALGLVRRKQLKLAGDAPAGDPDPAEVEAEKEWREALAAHTAWREAEREVAEALAGSEPDADEQADLLDEFAEEAEEHLEEAVPPRPPPRPIGYLILVERESNEEIRVAELALGDDQITAVTNEIRELFQGDM
jgi:hypothetical protein